MHTFRLAVTLSFVAVTAATVLIAPGASAQNVNLLFELFGTDNDPLASGAAIYTELEGVRRFVVEIEDVSEATGVLVFVNDTLVDDIAVTLGSARLERDTSEAQEVPTLTELSLIEVRTGAGLVLLSSDPEAAAGDPDPDPLPDLVIDFNLHGTEHDPLASGRVVYQEFGDARVLSIEAEDIGGAGGVFVFVNGVFLEDSAVVEGRIDIDLDTREAGSVPVMTEFSIIEIRNADTELLLLTSIESTGGTEDFRLSFPLFGTVNDPGASGHAVFSVLAGERRFVIEGEDVTIADGVLIFVDGELLDDVAVIGDDFRFAIESGDGQEVPPLTELSLIEVRAAGSELIVLSSDPEADAPGEGEGEGEEPHPEFDIPLFGTDHAPEAFGDGKYNEEGERRRLILEMVRLPSSGIFIFVNGSFVEDLAVVEGEARLFLDTREGHTVPVMVLGAMVEVRDAESDVVLLRGEAVPDDDDISSNHGRGAEEGEIVVLAAPPGLFHQWKKDGFPMPGENGRSLVFGPVTGGDSGVYTVVYDDGFNKVLVETPPYVFSVFPAGSLPAAGLWMLAITTLTLLGVSVTLITRRQQQRAERVRVRRAQK